MSCNCFSASLSIAPPKNEEVEDGGALEMVETGAMSINKNPKLKFSQ